MARVGRAWSLSAWTEHIGRPTTRHNIFGDIKLETR
jgi:hypothetical protein